jgi:Na+/proline symporter
LLLLLLAAAAAAGATIQVLLFAIMAVEIKRKAPTCHTVLEVVRVSLATLYALYYALDLI